MQGTFIRESARPSWRRHGVWLALALGLGAGAGTAGVTHWLGTGVIGAAHAEGPGAASEATGLATGGEQALAAGVRGILPRVMTRAARQQAHEGWAKALGAALEGSEAPEHVREALSKDDRAVFVDDDGLAPSGERLLWWLAEARHHGLPAQAERARALREGEAKLSGPTGKPAGEGADRVVAGLSDAGLVEAWDAAAAAEDRLLAATDALGAEVAEVISQRAERAHARVEDRARAEVALLTAAVGLAEELRPRPREAIVLEDKRGRYLPPEAVAERPKAALTAEELAGLRLAAAEGPGALDEWLGALPPQGGQYPLLVEASRRYEKICADGGWPEVKEPWATRGKLWSNETRIRALQQRLAIEGYWEGEATGVFDDATVKWMKRYQRNHQLRRSGSFTAETAAELNVPCEERLRTLRLNAQRWRHSARTDEPTYVEVNLGSQLVRFVIDGKVHTTERAVVGSGRWFWDDRTKQRVYPKASPILHDAISQVVVNPSWNVPGSIYRLEFKKKIAKDPDWLEKKGYELRITESGHEMVVQPPGPKNTLGDVKMLFPNSESVYLHDTSQRGYFNRARRDLSHGCIRVHHAVEFATQLLVHDYARRGERFSDRKLKVLARSDKTYWYKLHEPIPVFIEYYTAAVRGGLVAFFPDIYDYDRRHWEGPPGRR